MTDEPRSDAELTRLRSARFGRLPARVHPDDVVESKDTRAHRDRPEAAMSEDQTRALFTVA